MNPRSKVARCGLLATLLTASAGFAGQENSAWAQARDAEIAEALLYAYPYREFVKLRHQRHLSTPGDRWANGPITDA